MNIQVSVVTVSFLPNVFDNVYQVNTEIFGWLFIFIKDHKEQAPGDPKAFSGISHYHRMHLFGFHYW